MTMMDEAVDAAGRVLVIDDDENLRLTLARGLRRLGYDVLLAADGQQGLELASSAQPEVILLDLRMPGIDGHTFLRRMGASRIASAVVVMSGQGNMEDVIDVLRAGAVDYLRKPWTAGELAAAMARGIEAGEQKLERASAAAVPGPVLPAPPAPRMPPRPRSAVTIPMAAYREDSEADSWKQILGRVRSGEVPIPAVPHLVLSLRRLVQRPDASVDELVDLIEQDQRLAADVIRLANSAAYLRSGRSHSIKEAVSRIGFRQVHTIVETIFLRGFFASRDAEVRQLLAQIWRRSLAQAVTMRALAERVGTVAQERRLAPDSAYLIGLLADTGASFLLWVFAERRSTGGLPTPSAEILPSVRAHHPEVSAALVGRWLDDADAAAAVREHHPAGAPPATTLGRLLVVAQSVVETLGVGADPTAVAPPAHSLVDQCRVELGLSLEEVALVRDAAAHEFGELHAVFACADHAAPQLPLRRGELR
jgi:HD-like signal output (HDOD) protein/CheY-like chemotaxis protein